MNSGIELSGTLLGLQRATHHSLNALGESLGHLGLSAAEINTLANLADGRRRTVAELSAAVGSRSSTLTGILDRLEHRRLVRRQAHPTDRRSYLVVLTQTGAEVAATVDRAVADLERRLLAGLPATALAGFQSVLAALSGEGGR
ncbi:MAG TPA: MarR family transcriptional regulator [Pseudonocardiaceae bacterium]